ncbi:rod shape-determining protein [Fluviispira multicolorata]|uniref:Cell shape-determining protein MreB n=1 Tax=Fluviispira multicolorata TaxID=2654512 RepID=A0A833JED5_9BACT|nr:rod shape-determining protein [Fluviispira multicolorata]KAB8031834.1 rod shape-determining protein [Fluviispira multicolorata]
MFNFFKSKKIIYDTFIDLGTANTLIYKKGMGILINEPSIIAYDKRNKNTQIAVGKSALNMQGKAPSFIEVKTPLANGMVHDIPLAQTLIKELLKNNKNFLKDTLIQRRGIIISAPSDATKIEKSAFFEVARSVGGGEILLVEEPLSAAVGAGLDVWTPEGKLVVDVGCGITESVLISMGETVNYKSYRKGGESCSQEIIQYFRNQYDFLISKETAEKLKQQVSIQNLRKSIKSKIPGFSLRTKLPSTQEFDYLEIAKILLLFANQILNLIEETLENSPPELVGDLYHTGILLTGGGTLIDGLCEYLQFKLHIPVIQSSEPLNGVVIGNLKISEIQHLFPSLKALKDF